MCPLLPYLRRLRQSCLPWLTTWRATDVVDVHPKDNQSRALRVTVWLHSLDQNLVGGEDAAASLHLGDHRKGSLLNHFLSPGMLYLRTKDVFTRTVKDNWKMHQEHKKHYTDHLKKALPQRTELKQSLQHKDKKLALAAPLRTRPSCLVNWVMSRKNSDIPRRRSSMSEDSLRNSGRLNPPTSPILRPRLRSTR